MKNVANDQLVYIGLGSNIQQPQAQLTAALSALKIIPNTQLLRHSRFYQTKPVGFTEQPDFINAVAELKTNLSPQALFRELMAIEIQQQRVRSIKNGPRSIDLDILLFGDKQINQPTLSIPHPEYMNRLFVLIPLAELLPMHECSGVPIQTRIKQITQDKTAVIALDV